MPTTYTAHLTTTLNISAKRLISSTWISSFVAISKQSDHSLSQKHAFHQISTFRHIFFVATITEPLACLCYDYTNNSDGYFRKMERMKRPVQYMENIVPQKRPLLLCATHWSTSCHGPAQGHAISTQKQLKTNEHLIENQRTSNSTSPDIVTGRWIQESEQLKHVSDFQWLWNK